MSHVLNPIIERQVEHRWVDNPMGYGRYLDAYEFHAFCSCLWSTLGSTREAVEDDWMEHMNKMADRESDGL